MMGSIGVTAETGYYVAACEHHGDVGSKTTYSGKARVEANEHLTDCVGPTWVDYRREVD